MAQCVVLRFRFATQFNCVAIFLNSTNHERNVNSYDIILGTYGFWLPNDPRGSYSKFVWSHDLRKHGPATTVNTRHSRAADPHDTQARLRAKRDLKFPEVSLTGQQAKAIADGVAVSVSKYDFVLRAFAILEEHVHCVAQSLEMTAEQLVRELKRYGGNSLTRSGLHPLNEFRSKNNGRNPSVWARGFLKIFINTDRQLRNTIHYVEMNPVNEGKRKQDWSFVKKIDDLPHS